MTDAILSLTLRKTGSPGAGATNDFSSRILREGDMCESGRRSFQEKAIICYNRPISPIRPIQIILSLQESHASARTY